MAPGQTRTLPAALKQQDDNKEKVNKQEGVNKTNSSVKTTLSAKKVLPKLTKRLTIEPADDDEEIQVANAESRGNGSIVPMRPKSYVSQVNALGKKMAKASKPLPVGKGTHKIDKYLTDSGVGPIARYVMLPGDTDMIDIPRYNGAIGGREVAVANPRERIPASFDLATGTSVAFKFRDPYRSFVYAMLS